MKAFLFPHLRSSQRQRGAHVAQHVGTVEQGGTNEFLPIQRVLETIDVIVEKALDETHVGQDAGSRISIVRAHERIAEVARMMLL